MKNRFALFILLCCIAGCSSRENVQVSPCPNDLSFKDHQCFCGTAGLSPEDAKQWECIDQTHYLCLKSNGCVKDDIIYPSWSFLGDHTGSFDASIPPQPKAPKGYKLSMNDSDRYAWQCQDRDCACGKGILHGYNGREFCDNESFPAAEMRDCGDEPCKLKENGVCRDGKCWCGDSWQGVEAAKYLCQEHSVTGNEIYINLEDNPEIKPEEQCDASSELCAYLQSEFKKSKESPYDLICQAEEGCACGAQTCPKDTVCRQEKCYCGDIELSQWNDIEHYYCEKDGPNYSMVCTSKNGCICGEHRIVEGAECIDGKQVCHRMTFDWLDEKDIAQYMCDEVHPMIVCRNPKGCKCGKETCFEGASCIEGSCVCGNTYKLSSDIAFHRDQYICQNGAYTCNRAEGCECGLDEMCIQGAVCADGQCSCGEVMQATMSQYESYRCQIFMDGEYSLVCNRDKGCPCKEHEIDVTCDKDDVCKEYGCSYGDFGYEMRDPRNTDWLIGNQRFITRLDDSGETQIESCHDCSAFTAYEIEYDGTCHGSVISWMCMANGGCIHDGKHYPYGIELSETYDLNYPFVRYSGFPDIQYSTAYKGDAVAVCGHIYPYSALVSYLQSGKITEIRDTWVCDAETCACGSNTCHLGDLCQQGKCSPYKGCTPKVSPDALVSYCHGVQQSPEILPDNSDTDHYFCETQSGSEEKIKHWYCRETPCFCGEQSCSAGSYCQNGKCMCGDKPMVEGFICRNDKLVCNSASCQCGNEPLREGYACIDDRQLCTNKEGCKCGDRMTAYQDLCDHNVDICNPFEQESGKKKSYVFSSTHAGCLCGDSPLPPKYKCEAGKAICLEESCPCGDTVCGMSDVCDHGTCKCGTTSNNGCSCGNDVVRDAEHYTCIDDHLVCYSKEIRDSDHYPKELSTCTCGNEQIPIGAVCKDNHLCKDCPHTEYAVIENGYFHKTCDWKGKKVDIAYDYVADCYLSEEGRGYSCDDDTEYIYIRMINPCDCLNDPKTPQTEEELAKHFCNITQYYAYDCSERYPEETVEGWLSIDGESNTYDRYDPDNPCRKAAGTPNFERRRNTKDQTCLCGKYEIPMQDAEKYDCDLELVWRCNVESGCTCGDAVCQQSQVCLKPGVCSQ